MKKYIVSSLIVLVAWTLYCPNNISLGASPAGVNTKSTPSNIAGVDISRDLALLENRYFTKTYNNDPIEKRLERLELLVFSQTQAGNETSRLSKLKEAVAIRSATPLNSNENKKQESADATPNSNSPSNSTFNYPVLNTLEWRAFKKTFVGESLDKRLERMESKLFGQPSPTMAYIDRVDRIKRTLGIGVDLGLNSRPAPLADNFQNRLGPKPKARPRSSMDNMYSYGGPFDASPDVFGNSAPMPNSPFNSFNPFLAPGMNSEVARMFSDMNKQMQVLRELGPGSWRYNNENKRWEKVDPSADIPNNSGTPGKPAPNELFKKFKSPTPDMRDIPPYADPNSI